MLDPARALGLPVRLLAAGEFADVATGRRIAAGQVLDLSGEGMAALREPRRGERVSLVLGSRFFGIWSERGGRLASEVNFPEGVDGVRA
jgi:tRNA pseudouridine55 synthase